MRFHSIPLTLRSTSLHWLTRLMVPFVVGAILFTSTGCSMVMGFFGPTEADVTGLQEQPARLLVPTPIENGSASAGDIPATSGPTPTPFIMRPVTTVTNPATNTLATTQSLPASASSTSPTNEMGSGTTMQVTLTGDAVNVRNAPGLDTQVLATLPRGTDFRYVSRNDAGDWIQVCCVDSQVAWVYADLAQVKQGTATTQTLPLTAVTNKMNNTSAQSALPTGAGTQSVTQLTAPSTPSTTTPGTSIERTNETTRYTAKEDGFAVALPSTWLPFVDERGTILSSMNALQIDNPALAALIQDQISTLGDIPVSLLAFDLAPEALTTGFATNLNVMKQPIPAGFSLEYIVQFSADLLGQALGLSGTAQSTKVVLPAGEAILLDYEASGQTVARQYYLLHDQAVYILTFTSSVSLTDSTITLFDEMMQSFTFTQ